MSLEQQEGLITILSDLGTGLPGLNEDAVIENIVDKSEGLSSYYGVVEEEVKENLDRGMNAEDARKEADEKKEEAKQLFEENIRQPVVEQIAVIKQQYKIFDEGVKRIPQDVIGIIANIALPPAIAVPAAGPNPIYALNLTKASKNTLSGLLGVITFAFTEILKAATAILFVLPAPFLLLIEQLGAVTQLVESIPV